ncbi:MAG: MBL fold metallo-hydrolase [Proteobacteria bacterium]|nr:MBL fold metallo-hydrolase [Pseudomonadota bacterium]
MIEEETDLIIEQIEIGPMQNFTYIVGSRATREVVIVDPAWDVEGLINHIDERGYTLTGALVTHYHQDHIGGSFSGQKIAGLAELMSLKPVRVYAHKEEASGVVKVSGISDSDINKVEGGDRLKIGDIEVEFLHTPGHTPGSQCFRIHKTLVSGDTLFINGCGRVDLPGSNSEDMYYSIQKLASLPDNTLLLPGHNYSSIPNATLAETRSQNAYMNIKDLETWRSFMG